MLLVPICVSGEAAMAQVLALVDTQLVTQLSISPQLRLIILSVRGGRRLWMRRLQLMSLLQSGVLQQRLVIVHCRHPLLEAYRLALA